MSNKDNSRSIVVHQTLHGYRDGHELLGTSLRELPKSSRRLMGVLSDLSGDGSFKGFRQYLTGYPIEEPGLFAFARTWYADEMNRPGCVWTHTLLLAFPDLALLPSLSPLLKYFRRPKNRRKTRVRLEPIEHAVDSCEYRSEAHAADDELAECAAATLRALYGTEWPVLLPATETDQFEDLVLRIWSQQWPRLRRRFSFCTGSLSSREINKRPFDLQVVPRRRCKSIARSLQHSEVVDSTNHPPELAEVERTEEKWVRIGAADLYRTDTQLRQFLWSFGADVEGERTAFRHLVTALAIATDTAAGKHKLRDLLAHLAKAFPEDSEAGFLKQTLLSPDRSSGLLLPEFPEEDSIRTLLVAPGISAFDSGKLDLEARAMKLFRPRARWDPEPLMWLTRSRQLNELGKRILRALLDDLTIDELARTFVEHRDLFTVLLSRCPQHAKEPAFWDQPREFQRASLAALADALKAGDRAEVVSAIVRANAAVGEELFESLGDAALGDVLAALNERYRGKADVDEARWKASLLGREGKALGWFGTAPGEVTTELYLLVVGLTSPGSKDVSRLDFEGLSQHLIERRTREDSSQEYLELAAFSLAAALENGGPSSADLAAAAFQTVHDSAMESTLTWRAWGWLEPSMPRPNWFSFFDYDRAERLRRALVLGFLHHPWDPTVLARALNREDTRRRVARFCRESPQMRSLLRASGMD